MKNYCILLLLFISVASFGQPPIGYKPIKDTIAFKAQMQSQSKLIKSIESNFIQEKYLSVMSEKIITKGHLLFKKANMLRWEYNDPYQYVIAINKDKMFIKDNNKIKKYDINSNKMFRSINEMMMATVQGNLLNNKDYKATFFEGDKYYLIELSPVKKATKDFLKTIQLYINKTDYAVDKVKMIEPGDDYTAIDFINRKTNTLISDEKFTIK